MIQTNSKFSALIHSDQIDLDLWPPLEWKGAKSPPSSNFCFPPILGDLEGSEGDLKHFNCNYYNILMF